MEELEFWWTFCCSEGFSTLCFSWLSCKWSVSILSSIVEIPCNLKSTLNLFSEHMLLSLTMVRQHSSSLMVGKWPKFEDNRSNWASELMWCVTCIQSEGKEEEEAGFIFKPNWFLSRCLILLHLCIRMRILLKATLYCLHGLELKLCPAETEWCMDAQTRCKHARLFSGSTLQLLKMKHMFCTEYGAVLVLCSWLPWDCSAVGLIGQPGDLLGRLQAAGTKIYFCNGARTTDWSKLS